MSQLIIRPFMRFLFLFFCLNASADPGTEINLTQSRLIHLAQQIQQANSARKYDFLLITLQQMANAYAEETEKVALEKQKTLKKHAKAVHWQYSSYRYLDSIESAILQLDMEENPDFFISKQNRLIVLFTDQAPVVVSGPNNGSHKRMETNIVKQFCAIYDCSEYFKSHSKNQNLEEKSEDISEFGGTWSIQRDFKGVFVTDTGLSCSFKNLKNRTAKEQWMAELHRELILILEVLKKATNKGFAVNWPLLKLETLPLTDNAYKLFIDQQQSYIKVNVPVLFNNPELFRRLIPWLKQRFIKAQNLPIIVKECDRFYKNNHN